MRRRGIGGFAYVVLAAAPFAVPILATRRSWQADDPEASAAFECKPPEVALETKEVEAIATEGFDGLAAGVRSRPNDPTYEEVRRVMERRGCAGLRYALRVRRSYSDGSVTERAVLRHPYDEPDYALEFIEYLRRGPAEAYMAPVDPSVSPPSR